MNNKGVPSLRKLCIFQFTTNDENVNLGVYPESNPENIAYPSLFPVKCSFRILDITRVQKSTMKSSWGRGGARGAYLGHGLIDLGKKPCSSRDKTAKLSTAT